MVNTVFALGKVFVVGSISLHKRQHRPSFGNLVFWGQCSEECNYPQSKTLRVTQTQDSERSAASSNDMPNKAKCKDIQVEDERQPLTGIELEEEVGDDDEQHHHQQQQQQQESKKTIVDDDGDTIEELNVDFPPTPPLTPPPLSTSPPPLPQISPSSSSSSISASSALGGSFVLL